MLMEVVVLLFLLSVRMDNGQHSDTPRMDNSLVLYIDEKQAADDILVRRLKNRERQRRYRARKRHEADLRKALIVDQSTSLHNQQLPTEFQSIPVQVEISVNVSTPEYLTRVHCGRDWKKDARRAYVHKKQEVRSIDPNNSEKTSGGTPASISKPDIMANLPSIHSNIPILDNKTMHRTVPSKRNWKTEARNKKSLE